MHGTSEKKAWLQMKMIRVREQAQRNALVALCCFLSLASLYRFGGCAIFGKNVAADQGNQEMPARAVEKYSVSTNDELYYLISLNC